MKIVKIIYISDFKDSSDYDQVRLFYTCCLKIYIKNMPDPKCDKTGDPDILCNRMDCDVLKLTVHNSHVYCDTDE